MLGLPAARLRKLALPWQRFGSSWEDWNDADSRLVTTAMRIDRSFVAMATAAQEKANSAGTVVTPLLILTSLLEHNVPALARVLAELRVDPAQLLAAVQTVPPPPVPRRWNWKRVTDSGVKMAIESACRCKPRPRVVHVEPYLFAALCGEMLTSGVLLAHGIDSDAVLEALERLGLAGGRP